MDRGLAVNRYRGLAAAKMDRGLVPDKMDSLAVGLGSKRELDFKINITKQILILRFEFLQFWSFLQPMIPALKTPTIMHFNFLESIRPTMLLTISKFNTN